MFGTSSSSTRLRSRGTSIYHVICQLWLMAVLIETNQRQLLHLRLRAEIDRGFPSGEELGCTGTNASKLAELPYLNAVM